MARLISAMHALSRISRNFFLIDVSFRARGCLRDISVILLAGFLKIIDYLHFRFNISPDDAFYEAPASFYLPRGARYFWSPMRGTLNRAFFPQLRSRRLS